MDEQYSISFTEACQKYHIAEEILLEMIEHGLFDPETKDIKQCRIDYTIVQRIRTAHRLYTDLGVNVAGAVLVLELLDELHSIQKELDILQR